MAKLADARDLKSRDTRVSYRFDPGFRHHYIAEWSSPVARRAHNPKVMWFKSHLRNQHCEPKKISVRKTQKPQRFLGFFVPFFKVQFKRYHSPKTTFGEDLN